MNFNILHKNIYNASGKRQNEGEIKLVIIQGKSYTRENLGKIFDYALLNHDVTRQQVRAHVERGIAYGVNGIHCNPVWVPMIADMLEGTGIETGICPAFPFGAASIESKVRETEALDKALHGRPGCVDYVVNVGALKGGEYDLFRQEAEAMVRVGRAYGLPVKSILENAMLTDDELAAGCRMVSEAGVNYVKAASGRGGSPAMETIFHMRQNIADHVGIKFAGYGTYNLTQLTIMGLASGAVLFGTGYAHAIIEEICRHYAGLTITM